MSNRNGEEGRNLHTEGGSTTFGEVERSLTLFLRALWGRDIRLRVLTRGKGSSAGRRPTFDGDVAWLPQSFRGLAGHSDRALYRAAAAHASAHMLFSTNRLPFGSLGPLQVALVSLIEDARVEHLAMRRFPGLKRLWAPFHVSKREEAVTSFSLMARLSRALIDEDYADDQRWVRNARRMFFERIDDWDDQAISRTLGSLLGNDLEQMRDRFDFRTYVVEPAYRDDNMGLWDFGNRGQPGQEDEVRHRGARRSGGKEVQVGDQEEPDESSAGAPDDVERSCPQQQRQSVEEPLSSPIRYDEWDYLLGRERPSWCTVLEKSAPEGDARQIEQVLDRNRELVNRVKVLVRAVQVQRPERLRRRFDGDRLDLDAGIGATIELRSSVPPDPRVYSILGRKQRDLSVLVLLDLSQSTNDVAPGAGITVLELAREATVLLADAMDRIGDSFAIHGFASNGRHDIGYFRIKDFGRPYDDLARSRLAGMTGQLSTRMGTALRHAGSCLKNRRAHRKLVLLITDGEPSDIDVHDSQYLVLDARKAVAENLRQGIHTYCMSLDPKADRYVSRIFGTRNWTVVDHLRRLPEKLPLLYMRLTH